MVSIRVLSRLHIWSKHMLGIEPPYVAEQVAKHVITWPVHKLAQSVCELQPCPQNQSRTTTVATTVT